jgi:hypothetical protein
VRILLRLRRSLRQSDRNTKPFESTSPLGMLRCLGNKVWQ